MVRSAALVLALSLTGVGLARADDAPFELKRADSKVAVGNKGTTSLTIVAKSGWHLNEEAPIRVTLTPDAGLKLDKDKLERPDLAARTQLEGRFDIGFVASEPGRKTINAEARFVLCQAEACKPVKEKVALAIDVSAPAPAAAKKK